MSQQQHTALPLHLVQLCDKAHAYALVQRAAYKQPLLVWAPAEGVDGLTGQVFVRQLMHGASNTQVTTLLVLLLLVVVVGGVCRGVGGAGGHKVQGQSVM